MSLIKLFIDSITTDASDIERRIRTYREQLKVKEAELDKLKHRKNKETLKKKEDELKKQLKVIIIVLIY